MARASDYPRRGECGIVYNGVARDGRPYCIRKVKCVTSCECLECEHNPKNPKAAVK